MNSYPIANAPKITARRQAAVDANRWIEQFGQDLRFALRGLRKSPGFTAVAVLTLALGIGANTAIFSLINAVLLKSLPVPAPAELVIFRRMAKSGSIDGPGLHTSVSMYEFLRDRNRSFAGVLAFAPTRVRVSTGPESIGASGQLVTPNYFSVLGIKAALGRTWAAGDEAKPTGVVVSHRFWERFLGSDPAVVGRTLRVSGNQLTILGVTPPEFLGLMPGQPIDLTVLLAAQPTLLPEQGNLLTLGDAPRDDPGATWPLYIFGRLGSGVSTTQASVETSVLLRQWASNRRIPDTNIERSFFRLELEPGGKGMDGLRRRFAKPLEILGVVVAGVLLVACANVTNLLLARAAARRREMAVRLALGAGRARLVRQLLTESVTLGVVSGAAGILLGVWGSSLLGAIGGSGRTALDLNVGLDWRVLTLTAGLSVLTGVGVGLIPALRGAGYSMASGLKGAGGGSWMRGRRWRLNQMLVVAQLAVSLCLLVGTGLFVTSLRRITSIDPGFPIRDLLLVDFDWSGAGYDATKQLAFGDRALAAVREIPGVRAASATYLIPLGEERSLTRFSVRGFQPQTGSDGIVERNIIWPDYFKAMGIPLVAGREFNAHDTGASPKVAIVNESLARHYFGDHTPIGQLVWFSRDLTGTPVTIVGVAGDSIQRDLREAPPRLVFLPDTQTGHGSREPTLLVRTDARVPVTPARLRQVLAQVSPDISVREITTPVAQVERSLYQERLLAMLTGFFGPLALLLAAIGLHGLLAHEVAQRTREIGVRMALGAKGADVIRLVVGQGMTLVTIGMIAGLAAAVVLARAIRGLLFGVGPADPIALSVAATLLALVALLACWIPARRATRIDPMRALRCE